MPDDSNPTLLKTPPNLRLTPKKVITPRADDSIDADSWKPVSNLAGTPEVQQVDIDGVGDPQVTYFDEHNGLTHLRLNDDSGIRYGDEDILGDVEVGLGSGDAPKDAGEVEISELIDRLSDLAGDDEPDIFKLLPRVESALAALGKILSRNKDKNPAGETTGPVVETAGAKVTEEPAEPVVEPDEPAKEAPQEPEPARKVRDYERILKALGDLPSEDRGIFTSRYGDEGELMSVVNVERIKKLYGIFEDLTEEEVELHFKDLPNKKILGAWDEVFESVVSGAPLRFNDSKGEKKVGRSLYYTRVSEDPFEVIGEDEKGSGHDHRHFPRTQDGIWDVLDGDAHLHTKRFQVGSGVCPSPSPKTGPIIGPFQTYVMLRTVRGAGSYPNSGKSVHLKLHAGERVSFDGVHIRVHSIEGGVPQFFLLPGFSGAIKEGWARLEDKVDGKPVEASVPDTKQPTVQEQPAETSTGHTGSTGYVRTRLALPVDPMERRALVKFLASHDADLLTLDKSSVEVSIPR